MANVPKEIARQRRDGEKGAVSQAKAILSRSFLRD
jgi:hypothetical protein